MLADSSLSELPGIPTHRFPSPQCLRLTSEDHQALCLPEYAWEKTHILYHLCVRDSQAEHFFPMDRKGN